MIKRLLLSIFLNLLLVVPSFATVTQVTAPAAITTAINGATGHTNGQWSPRVAFNGAQTFMVVWEEGRNVWGNSTSQIYAARVQSSGSGAITVLDTSGLGNAPIASSANAQTAPRIVYGGGYFLVVWQELISGYYAIRAATITSSGTIGTAFTVSGGAYNQIAPDVCFDPTNIRFFVVWADFRNHSPAAIGYQIYGTPVYVTPAISVVNPSGIQMGTDVSRWSDHGPSVGCNGSNILVTWARRFGVDPYVGQTGGAYDNVGSAWFDLSGGSSGRLDNTSTVPFITYGSGGGLQQNIGPAVKTLVDSSGNFGVLGLGVWLTRGAVAAQPVMYSVSSVGVFNNQQYPLSLNPWSNSVKTDGAFVSGEYFVVFDGTTDANWANMNQVSTANHKIYGVRATPAAVQSNSSSTYSTDWTTGPFTLSTDASGSSASPAVATGTGGYVLLVYEHDNMTTPASHVLEASLLSVN